MPPPIPPNRNPASHIHTLLQSDSPTTARDAIGAASAAALTAETTARTTADTNLATSVSNEATTRAGADTALGNRVTSLETATAIAILLKQWTTGEAYELLAITRDSDDVVTSATVKWPDGTAGVFTRVTKNDTFLSIDAYRITYLGSTTRTVEQTAVGRNANGAVTSKPALTVTP